MIKNETNNNNNFLKNFIASFVKKKEPVYESKATEAITKEIDNLWNMVRKRSECVESYSVIECQEVIAESFRRLRKDFSDEQLDSAYAWPRYVKVAIYCSDEPIKELVEYLNVHNYIPLTKRLIDLFKSVCKEESEGPKKSIEIFSASVCHHILNHINSSDTPSMLLLGRIAQNKGEYEQARTWYMKIMETEEPFNGITSLLCCYEEEIRSILSAGNNYKAKEQVRNLNERQYAIYKKWCEKMEKHLEETETVSEQYKREYVSLITGYARFERNRGHYEKAFKLLEKIPIGFPDMYRVYAEEAMLYQFRPHKNQFYSLEKAIETFKKAYAFVENEPGRVACAKSKKSILMPLANTYFQCGRYKEASDICENILTIDRNEQRAISLKKRIAYMG